MPYLIGEYGPIATSKESYADGYKTGEKWKWDHTPGGPFIYSDPYHRNPDWQRYCLQSMQNNKEWLRGWREARGMREGTLL